MPTANDAVEHLTNLKHPLELRWLNIGRKSDNWKAKIFQHEPTGLQIAVYNRKSIVVLLQNDVAGITGTEKYSGRPKSDALKVDGSKFSYMEGICYKVDNLSALNNLVTAYFNSKK